jgi:hypothetical protein
LVGFKDTALAYVGNNNVTEEEAQKFIDDLNLRHRANIYRSSVSNLYSEITAAFTNLSGDEAILGNISKVSGWSSWILKLLSLSPCDGPCLAGGYVLDWTDDLTSWLTIADNAVMYKNYGAQSKNILSESVPQRMDQLLDNIESGLFFVAQNTHPPIPKAEIVDVRHYTEGSSFCLIPGVKQTSVRFIKKRSYSDVTIRNSGNAGGYFSLITTVSAHLFRSLYADFGIPKDIETFVDLSSNAEDYSVYIPAGEQRTVRVYYLNDNVDYGLKENESIQFVVLGKIPSDTVSTDNYGEYFVAMRADSYAPTQIEIGGGSGAPHYLYTVNNSGRSMANQEEAVPTDVVSNPIKVRTISLNGETMVMVFVDNSFEFPLKGTLTQPLLQGSTIHDLSNATYDETTQSISFPVDLDRGNVASFSFRLACGESAILPSAILSFYDPVICAANAVESLPTVVCTGGTPTYIELSTFDAIANNRKIILSWTTASEIDNAGFNLYRAESENGEFVKINPILIPAQGSPTSGASYEFVDKNVKNRITYYYKLEDIDLNGVSTLHGPVSATPRVIHNLR